MTDSFPNRSTERVKSEEVERTIDEQRPSIREIRKPYERPYPKTFPTERR